MTMARIIPLLLLAAAGSAMPATPPPATPPPATPAFLVGPAGGPTSRADTIEAALAAARDVRRAHPDRAVIVTFPAGMLRRATPIALTAADSGTAAAPLVLRAAPGGTMLSGARELAPAGTGKVTLPRPAGEAQWSVFRYGGSVPPSGPQFYQGGSRIVAQSWPGHGDATGWRFQQRADGLFLAPAQGALPPGDGALLVEGFFGADWAWEASPARREGDGLLLPGFAPVLPMRAEARLRIRGLASSPTSGTYAVGAAGLRIHRAGAAPVEQAVAPALLALTGVSHVRMEGLAATKAARDAVTIDESFDIAIADCAISHTGDHAIVVNGGRNVTIDRCRIDDTGGTAVRLSGGYRPMLGAGGHRLAGSAITRFARLLPTVPGVALWGVGNTLVGNRIAGGPHSAVSLIGNDHRIAGNEIAWTVCRTGDAGAIYMGRDWTQRGMVIEDNYIHDIGQRPGALATGVYLDDQFSGAIVRRNVFFRMPYAIYLGGGRDTLIERNMFARQANAAIAYDSRGTSWQREMSAPGGILYRSLDTMPYRDALWRERYPALATLLEDRPGEPVGNRAVDNARLESQPVWAQPPTLRLPSTGDHIPVLSPAEWAILDTADRLAAYRVMARAAGLAPGAPWQAVADPGIVGCA